MKKEPSGGMLGILLLLAAPLMIWQAHAVAVMWEWFVVPLWDLAPISTPEALGLVLLSGLVRFRNSKSDADDEEVKRLIKNAVLHPAFTLCAGWIVMKWIGA